MKRFPTEAIHLKPFKPFKPIKPFKLIKPFQTTSNHFKQISTFAPAANWPSHLNILGHVFFE